MKPPILILVSLALLATVALAQETQPAPLYEVSANDVNLRSDSTVNSEIICTLKEAQKIQVVSELYDWYKIRLPENAPSYVKKEFFTCISTYKTVSPASAAVPEETRCVSSKALKGRINIRLRPELSSPILGQINNNEIVTVLEDKEGWLKIVPPPSAFGWLHKKVVRKIDTASKNENLERTAETSKPQDTLTIEGTLEPYGKVFKRQATHKVITADSKGIYLIKGDRKILDTLNYRKVRITGKIISSPKQKQPVIEATKVEAQE